MPKYLFFIAFITLVACSKDPVHPDSLSKGYEYFPLKTGNYSIYQIYLQEKVASGFVSSDYQVKEVVADTFMEGKEVSFRLEKYTRSNSEDPWPLSPDSVFSVRISNNQLILTENNQRFVKLVFPVKEGKSWDGNAFNIFEEDEYFMEGKGLSFSIDGNDFINTVKVVQQKDTLNRVYRDYRFEVYAKNTGLVYKRIENLNFEFNSGDTTSGYIYTKKLLETGS